jgi:intracellular sulfur oxidation DsrE/DsrF family protein
MKRNEDFSDEILNAFIDEQLDHDERVQILSALRHDEVLTQRVCDLQKVRSLVQLAFDEQDIVPEYQQPATAKHRVSLRKGIAASVLIIIGVLSGWFTHQHINSDKSLVEYAKTVRTNPALAENEAWQLMLHVSHNETRRFNVLLNEAEHLLATYKKNKQPLKLEILANGKGLDLVKYDNSPHVHKLQQLQKEYDNLVVSVCGQTLQRIKSETGKNINLIPDANVVRSAIHQVGKRQKQGWTYIHI